MLGTIQGRRVWTEPKKKLGKQRECWRSRVEVGGWVFKDDDGGVATFISERSVGS